MRYFKSAAFLLAILSSSVPLLSRAANATNEAPEALSSTPTELKPVRSSLSVLIEGARGETNRDLLNSHRSSDTSPPSSLTFLGNSAAERPSQIVILDNLAHQSPDSSLQSVYFLAESDASVISQVGMPAPEFSQNVTAQSAKAMNLEDVRRLLQAPNQDADRQNLPNLSQGSSPETPSPETPSPETPSEDDLPTLEEGSPPSSVETEPNANPVEGTTETPPAGAGNALPSEGASDPTNKPEIGGFPDSLLADPNPLSVPTAPAEIDIERNPVVTLEQAIDLAYRNSQALQAALLQLERAGAALRQAQAARLPTLDVQSELRSTQQESNRTGPLQQERAENTTLNGSVALNYDLLTGGERSASIRAAELQQQVSALAVERQQEDIRLNTATAYYALQNSGEQIRINQAFVTEAEKNLRDSELRQDVGVGTRFDVLRADVQLANARQTLVQARADQSIARREIARLLNLPPTAGLETTPVEKAEAWPLNLEESILMAFQNRAELEEQLLQADISEQQRRIALSAVRPRVRLFANYGLENTLETNINGIDDDFNASTSFGVTFNLRLYDGGSARAAARQQEITGAIAEEQFGSNLDQIRFDVEQAFFRLQANDENIVTTRVAVTQAEEALSLSNLRLQAGVGTQLDVLTAQSALTQAQGNNIAAILGYNRSLAELQRAVSNLD